MAVDACIILCWVLLMSASTIVSVCGLFYLHTQYKAVVIFLVYASLLQVSFLLFLIVYLLGDVSTDWVGEAIVCV